MALKYDNENMIKIWSKDIEIWNDIYTYKYKKWFDISFYIWEQYVLYDID